MRSRIRASRACPFLFAPVIAFLLFMHGAVALPLQAGQTHAVGRLRVFMDHAITGGASRGFAPVRWVITNDGAARESLTLEISPGYASGMARSEQEVKIALEPGDRTELETLIPLDRESGRSSTRAILRSGSERVVVGLDLASDRPITDGRVIGLVAAARVPDADLAALRSGLPTDPEESAAGVFDLAARESWRSGEQAAELFSISFDELPRRTAGWSAVDTVFVHVDGRLPALEEWNRLIEWVRQGGQLALVGSRLGERIARVEGLKPWLAERHRLPGARAALPTGAALKVYRAAFGLIGLVELEGDASGPLATTVGPHMIAAMRALDAADGVSPGGSRRYPSVMAKNYRATEHGTPWLSSFPNDGLPILPVLGLLAVFTVLVGPVNVALSRRRRRPGQLLYAVPLISIVATVLVVGFGILRQGFGTEGFAHSLSIMDQVERQVTNVMRREMVLGRGGQTLRPQAGTTVFVPDHGAEGELRIVEDDGRELRLSGDFLPVRSRTDHLIAATATTRARLEWSAPEGGIMRVTNALGVDLYSLEVRGPGGDIYAAPAPVKQGATARLEKRAGSKLEPRFAREDGEPIFRSARLPRSGFLAEAAGPGPGVDDCSVQMEDLYEVHAIVGLLPDDASRWKP